MFKKFRNWLVERLANFDSKTGLLSGVSKGLKNFWNKETGSGLTDADIQSNEMSMQNAEDIYQRQVTGMQKAGLNPALMYGSGTSTAPEAPEPSQGASMSDLMALVMAPAQKALLRSQANDLEASADLKRVQAEESAARAENIRLVTKYYPQVTESQLQETASRIGLNLSNIDRNSVENALTEAKTILQNKENEYADRFFKARAEYEEAKTDEAKANAAKLGAEALLAAYENEYARANGAKLSSSSALAIVSAILSHFGDLSPESMTAVKDTFKPFGLVDNKLTRETSGRIDNAAKKAGSYVGRKLKSAGRRFRNWIRSNNPRRYEEGAKFWD